MDNVIEAISPEIVDNKKLNTDKIISKLTELIFSATPEIAAEKLDYCYKIIKTGEFEQREVAKYFLFLLPKIDLLSADFFNLEIKEGVAQFYNRYNTVRHKLLNPYDYTEEC